MTHPVAHVPAVNANNPNTSLSSCLSSVYSLGCSGSSHTRIYRALWSGKGGKVEACVVVKPRDECEAEAAALRVVSECQVLRKLVAERLCDPAAVSEYHSAAVYKVISWCEE